jgi:hypothetical protein
MRTASRPTPTARPLAAALSVLVPAVLIVPLLMLPVLAAGPALAGTTARTHQERFTLISNKADSSREQLRAAGVLTAHGYARVVTVTRARTLTRLVFARGTIRLLTYPKRRSVSVPTASCRFTEVVHGDYTVRGGAQRYLHATGSGVYITRIVGRLKKESGGGCSSQLARFWQRTRTWGSLRW